MVVEKISVVEDTENNGKFKYGKARQRSFKTGQFLLMLGFVDFLYYLCITLKDNKKWQGKTQKNKCRQRHCKNKLSIN
jgi:hypothetical protein